MKSALLITISFCAVFIFSIKTTAQTPFVRNFSPDDYKAGTQNWSIEQDSTGIMYFGNNDGVLVYDGVRWELVQAQAVVRSLCWGSDNRLYVGSKGAIGYLQPNGKGSWHFVTLNNKIPKKHSEFNDAWQCFAVDNKIYFNVGAKMFVYPIGGDSVEVVLPQSKLFSYMFEVNKKYYVSESNKGIYTLNNHKWELLESSDFFMGKQIFSILQYDAQSLLVATRNDGVFIYSFAKLTNIVKPLNTHVWQPDGFANLKDFLVTSKVRSGVRLRDGRFVLGTLSAGLILIDGKGNVLQSINTKNGLQDNAVYALHEDRYKQLWIAGSNGVSLYQNNIPFEFYTQKDGLEGSVLSPYVYNNQMYVATNRNIYVSKNNQTFESLTNQSGQNFQLLHVNDKLLSVNSPVGIFSIENEKATLLKGSEEMAPLSIYTFDGRQDWYWIGATGIIKTRIKNNELVEQRTIKGFNLKGYIMTFDTLKRVIWLCNNPQLYRLQLNEQLDSAINVTHCDTAMGLPTDAAFPYKLNNGNIIFIAKKGVYSYNEQNKRFDLHELSQFTKGEIKALHQDQHNNIWYDEQLEHGRREKGVLWWRNNAYVQEKIPFYKFTSYQVPHYFSIYSPSDTVAYFGTNKGLLVYYPQRLPDYDIPFATLIRRIYAGEDTLSFTNTKPISYNNNHLLFEFASTFYEDGEKNLFSYRLLGEDTTWSDWKNDVKKEYTNLSEGDYVFEVRSKNIYEKYGTTARYSFEIQSPWYRTWWAYILYFIISQILIWFIVRYNTRRLIRQKQRLELIVSERTAEIRQQKEEIQSQTEQLQEYSKELEKLSIVASETDNAVMIMDNEGKFLWVNEGFTRLYGYSGKEFIQRYPDVFSISMNENIRQVIQRSIESKQSVIYETKNTTKNGEELWVQTTITPIVNHDGMVEKLVAIDSDIRKLKKAEHEIRTKNEAITASIRYAYRIQQAILPIKNTIDQYFESFILYRPKDIVSGDFYWFSHITVQERQLFFVALVDCTGHGVPGAFMRMICSRLLNEIVNERHVIDTKEILEELDRLVFKSLQQKESDNNDGMDLVLCRFEQTPEGMMLQTCNAKNTVYIFRHETKTIETSETSHRSIGGSRSRRTHLQFKQQTFVLHSNDAIYMSSDGIIDQNNALRKRFGTPLFKQFIVGNQHLSLAQQQQQLELLLDNHQQHEDQRDDITVIALKIKT